MDSVFERMKKLIIFNLDTISKLVDDAEQIRKDVTASSEPKLKTNLLKQVDKMEITIQELVKQTVELFDTYKLMVKGG